MTRSMNHSLVNNVYMNNENDNSKNLKHNLVLKRMITHLTRKTGRRKKGNKQLGSCFLTIDSFDISLLVNKEKSLKIRFVLGLQRNYWITAV